MPQVADLLTGDGEPGKEDVYVYIVRYHPDSTEIAKIEGWGRDTQAAAEKFLREKPWPARSTDSFVAVDDWGYGHITAATPDLESWIGKRYRELKAAAH